MTESWWCIERLVVAISQAWGDDSRRLGLSKCLFAQIDRLDDSLFARVLQVILQIDHTGTEGIFIDIIKEFPASYKKTYLVKWYFREYLPGDAKVAAKL